MAHKENLADRILERFNYWFSSQGGIWETFVITIIVVLTEAFFPNLDPHGFYLLFYLTIYSAVTQPILAYSGKVSSEQNEILLEKLMHLIEQNRVLMERQVLNSEVANVHHQEVMNKD